VFENKVLRRKLGLKREEVAVGWRRLHNEELHNLYASPNAVGVIKSRRMGWMRHTVHMGEMRYVQNFCSNTCTEEITWKNYA
jgi:hypothetical protein